MLVSMRDCESRDGGFRKTQNRRFWEPAAGAEKLEVFEILYRTLPRGGGVSRDLKYLSKITGFLRYLSPMRRTRLPCLKTDQVKFKFIYWKLLGPRLGNNADTISESSPKLIYCSEKSEEP